MARENTVRDGVRELRREADGTDAATQAPSWLLTQAPSWLLLQKVTLPDRVAGYVHRSQLMERVMPTRRRLTVLKASGGFGKTTLLAECCRALREQGVPAAWVSLDEQDEPEVLQAYIGFVCQNAGLDFAAAPDAQEKGGGPGGPVGAVVRAIQALDGPFVIAFDEAERLHDPASVALLEFMLQRGPANLHLAVAGRRVPDGLNVTGAVLDGRAQIVETGELRFSRAEVEQFLDPGLSRRALSREMKRTAGWPFALRIARNRIEGGDEAGVGGDFAGNWIESCLFAGLRREDRDFVLDVALFDWIDAPLLDEVLERTDSMHRLDSMSLLAGLLQPVGGGGARRWRLHPLLREHCTRQRFGDTPERFRAVHRRIAEALARRGETVPAMRHAVEAGEPLLAGDILERAGGVRLWTRQGAMQLQAADRLLSHEAISASPRLALVRCLVLGFSGQLDAANRLYRQVAATRPPSGEVTDEAAFEHFVDDCIARGGIAWYWGDSIDSDRTRSLAADMRRLASSPRLDRLTRGHMAYSQSVLHQVKGEFDTALERLAAGRTLLPDNLYMTMYGAFVRGQVAMAQGRARESESQLRSARRIAMKSFVADPVPAVTADILLQELSLERNRMAPSAEQRDVICEFIKRGAPYTVFAAGAAVAIEAPLGAARRDEALAVADELLVHVRNAGLTSLARYLCALRVSVLVAARRLEDAGRAWRDEGLPEGYAGCVDLKRQTWREMEAVACARLRWLIASARFGPARALARALTAIAFERGLRRTHMRALALSVALEEHAGAPRAAEEHLQAFLELFAESPYAWAPVREREVVPKIRTGSLEWILRL
ncbi:MAG: hypothetical protein OXB97_00995 [Rhodospirillales bacterium]|nr:hypothetical protein [Rhodospirillales bacterium]